MESLSSQLPTLDKYIGRIKRQQTEDKDCLKWDIEVSIFTRTRREPSSVFFLNRKNYLIYLCQI
jgi:hypothetical protein